MLKSILKNKGIKQLSKKEQEGIFGGAYRIICRHPGTGISWTFVRENMADLTLPSIACDNSGGTTTIIGIREEDNVIAPPQ